MSVSFFKHKQALVDAYKDVLNEKSDTDWALFTYEGKDNELKVAGTGEDGLEELESEFNSSKIMYAFIRIADPKTSLNKFIFLHWQGEGAPANRKGACANHVRDVERFFKGAHITINARNEDDVTPEQIMEHVSRASASTYTFDKSNQSSYEEPPAPVGSVYKRINPGAEIGSTRTETYWQKQEREEEERKRAEERRVAEERKKYEKELLEREKESSERRHLWEKDREREISAKMHAAKLADDRGKYRQQEKEKWEADEKEFAAQSERGRKRSESIEKAAEAAHLVHKRDTNPRALWEQRINEANRAPPPEPRKSSINKEPAIESYEPRDDEQEAPPQQYQAYEEPAWEEQPTFEEDPKPAYDTAQSTYDMPENPSYQDTQKESYSNDYHEGGGYEGQQEAYTDQQENYQARALYDYQAEDDTEISFDPDDVITNIVMVDEGWWRGTGPSGHTGLFPANYVELMQ